MVHGIIQVLKAVRISHLMQLAYKYVLVNCTYPFDILLGLSCWRWGDLEAVLKIFPNGNNHFKSMERSERSKRVSEQLSFTPSWGRSSLKPIPLKHNEDLALIYRNSLAMIHMKEHRALTRVNSNGQGFSFWPCQMLAPASCNVPHQPQEGVREAIHRRETSVKSQGTTYGSVGECSPSGRQTGSSNTRT